MRRSLAAIAFAAALAFGAAEAAPLFGASTHRLGGGQAAKEQNDARALLEAIFAWIGFDLVATVEPVAREGVADQAGRPKECDRAKKAEVAKAETKDESEGGSSKGRSRTGEPVYLAF